MESYDTTSLPPVSDAEQLVKQSAPPSESSDNSCPVVHVPLRVFLFATSLAAIIVVVTSKQTKLIPLAPGITIPLSAKFTYEPSLIYLLVAIAVACFYSIVSGVLSVLALRKPRQCCTKLQLYLAMFDALLLGILSSALGAATAVEFIGLNGNSHSGWTKVCNTFDTFCFRGAASLVLSLTSSITLLLLVWLSIHVLYKKATRK